MDNNLSDPDPQPNDRQNRADPDSDAEPERVPRADNENSDASSAGETHPDPLEGRDASARPHLTNKSETDADPEGVDGTNDTEPERVPSADNGNPDAPFGGETRPDPAQPHPADESEIGADTEGVDDANDTEPEEVRNANAAQPNPPDESRAQPANDNDTESNEVRDADNGVGGNSLWSEYYEVRRRLQMDARRAVNTAPFGNDPFLNRLVQDADLDNLLKERGSLAALLVHINHGFRLEQAQAHGLKSKRFVAFAFRITGYRKTKAYKVQKLTGWARTILEACEIEKAKAKAKGLPFEYPSWNKALGWFWKDKDEGADDDDEPDEDAEPEDDGGLADEPPLSDAANAALRMMAEQLGDANATINAMAEQLAAANAIAERLAAANAKPEGTTKAAPNAEPKPNANNDGGLGVPLSADDQKPAETDADPVVATTPRAQALNAMAVQLAEANAKQRRQMRGSLRWRQSLPMRAQMVSRRPSMNRQYTSADLDALVHDPTNGQR